MPARRTATGDDSSCRARGRTQWLKEQEAAAAARAEAIAQQGRASATRCPVAPPGGETSAWQDEAWRLQRLYSHLEGFSLQEEPSGDRVLRVTHHCSDPDWEAINWAPDGLRLELRVPAAYPEPEAVSRPSLSLLGPESLPARFMANVPVLFAESARTAPPRTAAIYRGLQHLDRFLAPLFLKVRALERKAQDEAAALAARNDEEARRQRECEEKAAAEKVAAVAAAEAAAAPEHRRAAAASWSNEEQERLEEALVEFMGDDDARSRWMSIAEHVGGGRSARDCADRYKACQDFALGRSSHPDDAEVGDSAAAAEATTPVLVASWSEADVRRQGVEIRFIGLMLEGIDTMIPTSLRIQVVCSRCKKPSDVCSDGKGTEPRTLEEQCDVCKQQLAVRIVPEICHSGCSAIAHVLGVSCHPTQVHRGDFEATCSGCMEPVRIRNVGPGFRKRSSCANCFEKLNLSVDGADMIGMAVSHWRQVAESEGEKQSMRRMLQEARSREKEMGIKAGQPLPDFGACKHYSKSYRWFRFPCCGRAFACDVCHDEQMDHPHEWANRMLCGHCAHEQLYRDTCVKCGAAQTRHKSAYWEGGEGCRNRTLMSKSDNHKYKGLGKTVSSRAAAKTASK